MFKWWVEIDGIIDSRADDNVNIGDTRSIYKHYPICDNCGNYIFDTKFGECDENGKTLKTLCMKCNFGYYVKKVRRSKKEKEKGILVFQRCIGM
jgi:hypothetical protein